MSHEDAKAHKQWRKEPFSKVLPNLWVGGVDEAQAAIRQSAVTHVLSIYDDKPLEILKNHPTINNLYLYMEDTHAVNILQHLPRLVEWIEQAHINPDSVVMVHCRAGISRSVTVIAAYLMKTRQMTFLKALKFIKLERNFANPNRGFRFQLELYSTMGYKIDQTDPKYQDFALIEQDRALYLEGLSLKEKDDEEVVFDPNM